MFLDKISIPILARMDSLAIRLRVTRKLRNLSQKDLANRIGVTSGAISQYESSSDSATEPTLSNLIKIAIALDVSFEWLATGRGEQGIEDFLLNLTKMYKQDDRLSLLLSDDQIGLLELYKKLPKDWQEKYKYILKATVTSLESDAE